VNPESPSQFDSAVTQDDSSHHPYPRSGWAEYILILHIPRYTYSEKEKMSDRHAHFRQTTPPVEKVGEEEDRGTPMVEENEPIPFSRSVILSSFRGDLY